MMTRGLGSLQARNWEEKYFSTGNFYRKVAVCVVFLLLFISEWPALRCDVAGLDFHDWRFYNGVGL